MHLDYFYVLQALIDLVSAQTAKPDTLFLSSLINLCVTVNQYLPTQTKSLMLCR